MKDSQEYLDKRAFFDKILTIYGRNALLEALRDKNIKIYKLHLSASNKNADVISDIIKLAQARKIPIEYHDKKSLSRISKNSKQDQGVALDIVLEQSCSQEEFMKSYSAYRILALDGIQNPQNLGMIIRSAAAGNIDAIILPSQGASQISPLVIKASAGTLFAIPIIKTKNLSQALKSFQAKGATLYTLSSYAQQSYKEIKYSEKTIFILGNESDGVSKEIEAFCDKSIVIPMQRGVESLNVAVTASLLAFI